MSNVYDVIFDIYGNKATTGGNSNSNSAKTDPSQVIIRDEGIVIGKKLSDINFVGSSVTTSVDQVTGKTTVAISSTPGAGGNPAVLKQNLSGNQMVQFALVSEKSDGTIALCSFNVLANEMPLGVLENAIPNTGTDNVITSGVIPNALLGKGFASEDPVFTSSIAGDYATSDNTGSGQLPVLVGYASGSNGQDLRLSIKKLGRKG